MVSGFSDTLPRGALAARSRSLESRTLLGGDDAKATRPTLLRSPKEGVLVRALSSPDDSYELWLIFRIVGPYLGWTSDLI